MKFYIIGSILKIVIGSGILYLTNKNINPSEDFWIGLGFILLGFFLVFWGLSFWIFLFISKFLFKHKKNLSISYQASFILGLFLIINIGLILTNLWSKYIGLATLLVFTLLNYLIIKDG